MCSGRAGQHLGSNELWPAYCAHILRRCRPTLRLQQQTCVLSCSLDMFLPATLRTSLEIEALQVLHNQSSKMHSMSFCS